MPAPMKLIVAAVIGLCSTAIGAVSENEARATTEFNVQQANPTITITAEEGGTGYLYSPAELNAKVGQDITITNNDAYAVHSVTADDGTFNVDVPPSGSVTLTIGEAGSYPYSCIYHTDQHNPASIEVS